MNTLNALSTTISEIAEDLEAIDAMRLSLAERLNRREAVTVRRSDITTLVAQLRAATQLARAIETEVSAHRLAEASRAGRTMVEELASEVMSDVLVETRGNVVHANFGRKP